MSILSLLVVVAIFVVCIRFSNSAIHRFGARNDVSLYRIKYIAKTTNIVLSVFFLVVLANISGLEYSQISFFLSSVFAVIGIALFAQWSILSNITASLIIFFGFPYRVGDNIKIIDGEEAIYGVIEEITLFHVLIKREDELITYPNSLILQKGVIKNPKQSALSSDVTGDNSPEQ